MIIYIIFKNLEMYLDRKIPILNKHSTRLSIKNLKCLKRRPGSFSEKQTQKSDHSLSLWDMQ